MDKKPPFNKINSSNIVNNVDSDSSDMSNGAPIIKKDSNDLNKSETATVNNKDISALPKKPVKPPKLEDKPFAEFVNNHFLPQLKASIEEKGTFVREIKLIQGIRPVVGGNCWMVFCEMSEQRKFWLCFNKEIITSDKTILLAESNTEPSIVESFLIDEKKTTLPLLISRVLQRLNGQKWIGAN